MDNTKQKTKRFFEYGFLAGFLPRGSRNSISDVPGVLVGHCTRIEGDDIRTGVTVIDPGISNLFRKKIPCAIAVGNGFGKLVGSTQVEELGTLEAPIGLTNTLAVGPVMRGLVDIVIAGTPDIDPMETVNVIVGETNDGFLNAIHKDAITKADARTALDVRNADFAVGNVGAGTGTRAFSWKGGIGTASRSILIGADNYTVGILAQTNYGGSLTILGVPVGKMLGKSDFDDFLGEQRLSKMGDGSCVVVIATDAPLMPRQLKRLARRAFFGLARTGSVMAHGSGDYAIAFSVNQLDFKTSSSFSEVIEDKNLTPFFLAAVEAVEESVYDALFSAETMVGRSGNILEAFPKERAINLLEKYVVKAS